MTVDLVDELAREFTHERWGTFEVGADAEQRAACRYLRTAAITLAAEVRRLRGLQERLAAAESVAPS